MSRELTSYELEGNRIAHAVTDLKWLKHQLNSALAQLATGHSNAQLKLAEAVDLFDFAQNNDPSLVHYSTWWVRECQRTLTEAAMANSDEAVRVIQDQIAATDARLAPMQADLDARAAKRVAAARGGKP